MNSNLKSLDYKRIAFCTKLENYYKAENHSSDELIERLNEIDYDKRLSDINLSAVIGTLLGVLLGFVNEPIEFVGEVSIALKLLITIFVIGITTAALTYGIMWIIKFSMKLTSYTKLHCETFEKNLIEQRLAERIQEIKIRQDPVPEASQCNTRTHNGNVS